MFHVYKAGSEDTGQGPRRHGTWRWVAGALATWLGSNHEWEWGNRSFQGRRRSIIGAGCGGLVPAVHAGPHLAAEIWETRARLASKAAACCFLATSLEGTIACVGQEKRSVRVLMYHTACRAGRRPLWCVRPWHTGKEHLPYSLPIPTCILRCMRRLAASTSRSVRSRRRVQLVCAQSRTWIKVELGLRRLGKVQGAGMGLTEDWEETTARRQVPWTQ